jgi:nucleoside-diphosphate-sugar epimerase
MAGDEGWTNWCHLDDAVQAVLAVLDRGRDGGVYHGSDAHPARRREVVEFVAGRLGIPPPRSAVGVTGGRRGTSRRILSERTRGALGITLRYPSFREGLAPHLPPADGRPCPP